MADNENVNVQETYTQEDINSNRAFGILAYWFLLVLIPFFVRKDSPFAKFHVKQGFVLLFIYAAGYVLDFFYIIPYVGWIFGILGSIITVFAFVLSIIGTIGAARGQANPLPIVGKYSDKIKFVK
ncbi:MAG: hypothetical protein IKX06_02485 [Clostridia bacterium]|nr:hypothetical protein [Clostridia bacterium]